MKQIIQRVAFFSFLGCLTLVGIASRKSNPHFKCDQEWKHGFVTLEETKESFVVTHSHENNYELSWTGNIFRQIAN